MDEIKKYHLYKDDHSKLHFQINDAASYCAKNEAHCYKPHQHSFYQFIWFQESGLHYVDYEVIEHQANTLFFLDKKQVHNFCKDSSNKGILFHFDEVFLHQQDPEADGWLQHKLFNAIGPPYIQLTEGEVNFFKMIAEKLGKEMENKDYNYAKQVFYLFRLLTLSIERQKHIQSDISSISDKDYKIAVAFKKAIQENIHAFLSVDQFSEKIGVSPKKLTSISKKYLDDTPLNVIHARKILEAKRQLSNTNTSIKELAYSLGFDQPTYFTKYFKKHTGLTPKEFTNQVL
ncbi:helix-turn-helix transcriptional regulator [Ekhidna sp.]